MNVKNSIFVTLASIGLAALVYFSLPGKDTVTSLTDIPAVDTVPNFEPRPLNSDNDLILQDTRSRSETGGEMSLDSITELQNALAVAVSQREEAEEALRVLELKVGALESQLDDIETRGDNPADVQDETLDSFQAMFAEYQDTVMTYEEAAAKEQWIKSKLNELSK